MAGFTDIERFADRHQACGELVPTTSTPIQGGYLLTLTCRCGDTLDRWISPEEGKLGPPLAGIAVPALDEPLESAEPGDIETETTVEAPGEPVDRERLEAAMKAALDAVEAEPAHESSNPAMDALIKEALDSLEAPPPKRQRRPAAPTADLQDVLRATLDAVDSVSRRPASGSPTPSVASPTGAASARPQPTPPPPPKVATAPTATRTRPVPDKQVLQAALKTALEAVDAEGQTRSGSRRLASGTAGPRDASSRHGRRRSSITATIVIVLLIAVAGGAWYVTHATQVTGGSRAGSSAARPKLTAADRTSAGEALTVLRELASLSRVDAPYRVYSARVAFTKSDGDRFVQAIKDPDLAQGVREAFALHALAAKAWTAKTVNEQSKWAEVGDDATVDLCPAAKRLTTMSDDVPNMSLAEWRGVALAAAIPLLWDCAAARVAHVDEDVKSR